MVINRQIGDIPLHHGAANFVHDAVAFLGGLVHGVVGFFSSIALPF